MNDATTLEPDSFSRLPGTLYQCMGLRLLPAGLWFIVLSVTIPAQHVLVQVVDCEHSYQAASATGIVPSWVATVLLPVAVLAVWVVHLAYKRKLGWVRPRSLSLYQSLLLLAALAIAYIAVVSPMFAPVSDLALACGILTAATTAICSASLGRTRPTQLLFSILSGAAVAATVDLLPGDFLLEHGGRMAALAIGMTLIVTAIIGHWHVEGALRQSRGMLSDSAQELDP